MFGGGMGFRWWFWRDSWGVGRWPSTRGRRRACLRRLLRRWIVDRGNRYVRDMVIPDYIVSTCIEKGAGYKNIRKDKINLKLRIGFEYPSHVLYCWPIHHPP